MSCSYADKVLYVRAATTPYMLQGLRAVEPTALRPLENVNVDRIKINPVHMISWLYVCQQCHKDGREPSNGYDLTRDTVGVARPLTKYWPLL